jgi:hypothetical protein
MSNIAYSPNADCFMLQGRFGFKLLAMLDIRSEGSADGQRGLVVLRSKELLSSSQLIMF